MSESTSPPVDPASMTDEQIRLMHDELEKSENQSLERQAEIMAKHMPWGTKESALDFLQNRGR